MKNVIMEYAGSVIAVLGTVSFFSVIGNLFINQEGMLAAIITAVLGGL